MALKQVFATNLTDVNSQAYDAVRDCRVENGLWYKYVKFAGTTAINVGDVCCYVLTDTTFGTVDGANSTVGAGLAMAAVPVGAAQYGWVQTKGLAVMSTAPSGGAVAGDNLTVRGAAAPGMALAAAANDQLGAILANVAARQAILDFPF